MLSFTGWYAGAINQTMTRHHVKTLRLNWNVVLISKLSLKWN